MYDEEKVYWIKEWKKNKEKRNGSLKKKNIEKGRKEWGRKRKYQ